MYRPEFRGYAFGNLSGKLPSSYEMPQLREETKKKTTPTTETQRHRGVSAQQIGSLQIARSSDHPMARYVRLLLDIAGSMMDSMNLGFSEMIFIFFLALIIFG